MHPAPTFAMLDRGDLRLLLSAPSGLGCGGSGHLRNDIVTGVGGRQILVDDPSGNRIELFESF
ncbi:MAG: hypothetical protein ACRDZM_04120 [Acidimicrobiia bacterium]